MSRSTKWVFQNLIIAGIFGAIGFAFGAGFFTDLTEDGESDVRARPSSTLDQVAQLKSQLAEAQRKIALLQEGAELPLPETNKSSTTEAPKTKPLATEGKSLAQMKARIAELEAALAKELKKYAPMTDDEMKAHLASVSQDFSDAIAAKDPSKAMSLMKKLAKLDKRAYPQLVEMWDQMRKNKWLGLDRRQRYGWANANVFHWALDPNGMALADASLSEEFRKTSVWMLSWYEKDASKKAETYANFIGTLEMPGELTEEQKKRGRWNEDADIYRTSLRSLARIASAESSEVLSRIAANNEAPDDIRLSAVRGLIRQQDVGSERALRAAISDPNPKIRQTAEIGLVRRDPPVNGWLITEVTKGSQAETTGILPGSIIVGYNGKPVASTRDLVNQIRAAKGSVTVEVFRNGATQNITVQGGQRLGVDGEGVKPKDA